MRVAFLLALAAVLGVTGQARAAGGRSAECLGTDPKDFNAVYACMSSFRNSNGQNVFLGNIATSDCRTVRMEYKGAVEASLVPGADRAASMRERQNLSHSLRDGNLIPSCEILARAVREMTGNPPYWGGCAGWDGAAQDRHLKSCLETMKAQRLQGCGDVFARYEQGLRAADPESKLPVGYARPDCTVAADYLASLAPRMQITSSTAPAQATGGGVRPAWEPCMDYDPADVATHLRRCLGIAGKIPASSFMTLTSCQSVRSAYEAGLTKAYGRLPDGYVGLPCSVADTVVADVTAEKTRIEEEKRLANAEIQRQVALSAATVPAPGRGFFSGERITWTILAVILAGGLFLGWRFIKRRAKMVR